MNQVTRILTAIEQGDPAAAGELLPLVYAELRELAAQKLAREPGGQTLQGTALVHEAYVRLVGTGQEAQRWDNRGHFFAAAAEAMRRILVENARRKRTLKRGGDLVQMELLDQFAILGESKHDLLVINEVLEEFERIDPQKAALVRLRFFAGLDEESAASALGISRATASRHWAFAKAWMYSRLQTRDTSENPSMS